MSRLRFWVLGASVLTALGCVGTTGGELFELQAYAAGPPDAAPGVTFQNSLGYRVELEEARLFVGGLYLNRSRATSVSSDTSCSLAGIYVAEVLSGREIDLLSPSPQVFPRLGFATTERALTGEVWLSRGDVNEPSSGGPALRVRGRAQRAGRSYLFEGELSIGRNRLVPPTDPALPGQHPICKQRIVSPIEVDMAASNGRALLLHIDARNMFGNVDFETLAVVDGRYRFADETGVDQASDNLYAGMRRSNGVYAFSWLEEK